MPSEWKDISSYSKGDKERSPQSWEMRVEAFRIIVTRHFYHPGKWLLCCEPYIDMELASDDGEDAKREALEIMATRFRIASEELANAN